jgi:hypothetical protein
MTPSDEISLFASDNQSICAEYGVQIIHANRGYSWIVVRPTVHLFKLGLET